MYSKFVSFFAPARTLSESEPFVEERVKEWNLFENRICITIGKKTSDVYGSVMSRDRMNNETFRDLIEGYAHGYLYLNYNYLYSYPSVVCFVYYLCEEEFTGCVCTERKERAYEKCNVYANAVSCEKFLCLEICLDRNWKILRWKNNYFYCHIIDLEVAKFGEFFKYYSATNFNNFNLTFSPSLFFNYFFLLKVSKFNVFYSFFEFQ